MTVNSNRQRFTLEWRGIHVQIDYHPDWLSCYAVVLLELRTRQPQHAVLPVTETGYKAHYANRATIEQAGGPVAYVTAWLDHWAEVTHWQPERQGMLF